MEMRDSTVLPVKSHIYSIWILRWVRRLRQAKGRKGERAGMDPFAVAWMRRDANEESEHQWYDLRLYLWVCLWGLTCCRSRLGFLQTLEDAELLTHVTVQRFATQVRLTKAHGGESFGLTICVPRISIKEGGLCLRSSSSYSNGRKRLNPRTLAPLLRHWTNRSDSNIFHLEQQHLYDGDSIVPWYSDPILEPSAGEAEQRVRSCGIR